MSAKPIVVEQSFEVSKDSLWEAITQHDQMIQWFFADIPAFRAEEGFETEFNVSTGERDFLHLWKITKVVPGEKIVYDWRYRDLPGQGSVTFEVAEDGGGSRLRVINEGLETFPQDLPEFSRESAVNGWSYFVQGSLKQYLDGK